MQLGCKSIAPCWAQTTNLLDCGPPLYHLSYQGLHVRSHKTLIGPKLKKAIWSSFSKRKQFYLPKFSILHGFMGGKSAFWGSFTPSATPRGKYGPSRSISHPQTLEIREFMAQIHCLTTRTKYHFLGQC